jgi:opine dehydrogenase
MAEKSNVAVLGGGNGAFITAADLTLRGHRISLCELPHLEKNIEGIVQSKTIELQIVGNPGIKGGLAHLDKVTTNMREALSGAEVVLMVLPAFAQKPFAEACVPYLEDEQIVVLTPGNFGGLPREISVGPLNSLTSSTKRGKARRLPSRRWSV